MTSDLVSSSSITHQPKNHCYDVFLSFRGDDTRDNFVSHLHKALSSHQIKTFIDYNLTKGADFPPALLTAIEESLISIIILSENYADSTWCLKELAKIMECKNSNEQIVLPVFYGVDPSHVRNQTGNFGAAFHKLQEFSKGKMNFDKARSHLMEAANISGWDSHVTRPESQLIVGIVGDVLHKLNLVSFSYATNLVGVFPHIEKVESLLCLESSDVSVVGIWGMGGIGKSTIARAVFNHIWQKFDASHFVSNLQDELKRQSLDTVRESLLLKIFEKECRTMGTHNLGPDFIRRQLQQKKVFIVLDDVNDLIQLKELLEGQNYSFGSGSKILITSRDRQVLKNVTDKIHKVKTMNENDAMTLFSLNAFKQKYPTNSYKELSKRAIYYADGNPLALVVLGSALFDRSKEVWVSALEGLEKEPNIDIKNVLRSSYDTLSDGEKKIFLDIACFLFVFHLDFIHQYYGNSGIFKIKTLEDKCLVTICSYNIIWMHDLLREIGQSIDPENYLDKPEKHERLWNPKDVCSVLTKKTGAPKIEALSMNMCQIKEVHLDGDVFVGMDSLRFLNFFNSNVDRVKDRENKVCFIWNQIFKSFNGCRVKDRENKVYFNGGRVEYLPPELRYFQWDGFPAKHLPSKFVAENLIELRLNGSNIKKLWRRDKSQGILTNLQVISLRKCSNLIKIPDMSKAKSLRRIDLSGCKRCGNVPSVIVSNALEYVDLSDCLKVRRFPDISSKSLKMLILSGTSIEEVPSSIEYLSALEGLNMNYCRKLSTISTNICKLKSLTCFQFEGCAKLERFPEILEPMKNLKKIWLDGCKNLKSLPRNWYNMESLEEIKLSGCENLNSLSSNLYFHESGVEELLALTKIETLHLENCHSLNISIVANAIPSFSFLKDLYLRGHNWKMLPENMDQLVNLKYLNVSECKRLRSVPKLPSSLQTLEAEFCESLESIRIGVRGNKLRCLMLTNCFKLQEELLALTKIETLHLENCHSLNISTVANSIPCFSFLKKLHLGGNNWEMLPENMDQLANLEYLNVRHCKRLRSVPKLPSSLKTLLAQLCESLENVRIGVRGNKLTSLSLRNCLKLQEVTRNQILAHSHFMMTQLVGYSYFCVLPGTEIPEWMRMGVGSCVTIKFPSSHDIEYWSQFRGFSFCAVLPPISAQYFHFQYILKEIDHVIGQYRSIGFTLTEPVKTEHLCMWRCTDDRLSKLDLDELMGKEVSFEFSIVNDTPHKFNSGKVSKCGVQVLFENTLPTSLISSATNTEDDQLLISASSSIPPSPEKPSKRRRLKCLPFLSFSK